MATAKTKSDALGYYLSDPAGLGGARSDAEFWPLEFAVNTAIAPIIIGRVSAACGAGAARIVGTAPSTLQFAAPGEDLGAAVTLDGLEWALLESETPGKSIRVYRDTDYSAADLGGEMLMDLVAGMNNAIGLENATAAGGTHYGCIWMVNHSGAAITSVSITAGTHLAVALETPVAGLCQTIADSTTAPTSVTFAGSASIATLADGEARLLWIRRTLTAPAASVLETSTVTVVYTSAATVYTDALQGNYRVSDAALEGYELHLGEDALPDFATAAAVSATLPMVEAVTPGARIYWAVRARNEFGLESLNTLCDEVLVGAGGDDETEVLTDPEVVDLTSAPGGEVDLRVRYNGSLDASPADTWRVYVTTDGIDPDPGTDTPDDTTMVVTGLARPEVETILRLGPYPYGVTVKIIARVYHSTLEVESDSVDAYDLLVTTQGPVGPHQFSVAMGGYRGVGRSLMEGVTYYDAPTNSVGVKAMEGETVLFSGADAFRASIGNFRLFRTGFEFSTVPQGAAGSASPIEVISADEIYINVESVRRVRIDFAAGVIEASSFSFTGAAIDFPVVGPVHTTAEATYLMARHPTTGRWTPVVKVDNTGRFTACAPVLQEIA